MLKTNTESEWVFVCDDGQQLSYEALRGQTRCLCKAADVPCRGGHVFRHTFLTNCYHKGVDVKILSRLLGHADVNITYNIYVHLYREEFDGKPPVHIGQNPVPQCIFLDVILHCFCLISTPSVSSFSLPHHIHAKNEHNAPILNEYYPEICEYSRKYLTFCDGRL